MIKILHAADFHLDSSFGALGARLAVQLRQEQRQLLMQMTELGNAEGCQIMLLAGDLFDSDNAFPETLKALKDALAGFRGQVFIAPGNHDCLYAGSPYLSTPWPENVHIFTSRNLSSVYLEDLGCEVYGAGFTSPAMPSLLEGFHVHDEDSLNIMVLHGDAETAQSTYNPIHKEQIAQSGLNYLALGHIHKRQEPLVAGKTAYAWPGCAMGRGFDELGEKGVFITEVSPYGVSATFHPLATRKYEILSVECGDDPLSSILSALPQDTSGDIYRIYLTGQCEKAPDISALTQALESRFFSLQLRDKTERIRDIWQDAGQDTLQGQFLALLRDKMNSAETEEEKSLCRLAAQLGLRAMEGREEELV
ncbi:MAG: metallophosphoesterase [Oscillospiraceae bacterium]|nr:metallophosphoesterase [Oscillospiraceae bacterium]